MKIETLENGDRRLELSEYERDILIQVATYLHDFYDDLEFDLRRFTKDQVLSARSILVKGKSQSYLIITNEQTELIHKVFREAEHFVSDLIYDSKIDENEEYEVMSGKLFDMLFNNLRACD